MAQLELKGVVAAYGPISALHGVSLSVDAGGSTSRALASPTSPRDAARSAS